MNDAERSAWLRFGNLQLTARLASALLRQFGHDPQHVFAASDSELSDVSGFQSRHLVRLRDPQMQPTDRQKAWLERQNVWLLHTGMAAYPALLQEITDPPPLLFVRGQLPQMENPVGIVGSRRATPYGRAVAERLARELAEQGLTIISGGAVGIDAAAHRGAIEGGGATVAVLGCGLDVDYPKENRALFELIVQHGALITEYPLGAQPEAWRFPARNRLISGMSPGVLVVEAPERSGALNTAAHAAEQGRIVMAIPGNIDRPSSVGTNRLIRDGATIITQTEEVLLALELVPVAGQTAQTLLELDWQPETISETRHSSSSRADSAPKMPASDDRKQAQLEALPEEQRLLLEHLSTTPRHVDWLAQTAGISIVTAGTSLVLMEMAGLVKRLAGNQYIRNTG